MAGIRKALLLGAALVGTTGCFEPSEEAVARLEQVKAQAEELDTAMASLEERFLGNQFRVMQWTELAERHQHVSEIACRNHGEHFSKMAAHFEKQNEKARMLKRRRNVARNNADTVLTRGGGMGGPDGVAN